MDRANLRQALPSLIAGHLPRNARQFSYRIYDDQPQRSSLGCSVDPQPFRGTVIAKTDDAIVLKVGRIAFAAVDRTLATADPEPDTIVEVVPYARRDFDGRRVDAPDEERHESANGHRYSVQTIHVGGRHVALPLPPPRCPQLADLIEQLEQRPAPDGFRTIAQLLVDAGARDFSCVDPEPEAIAETPPEVAFEVATAKFSGRAAIVYDCGLDLYVVELRHPSCPPTQVLHVEFTSLGTTLEALIDDGAWRRIRITVLEHTRRRRN